MSIWEQKPGNGIEGIIFFTVTALQPMLY